MYKYVKKGTKKNNKNNKNKNSSNNFPLQPTETSVKNRGTVFTLGIHCM